MAVISKDLGAVTAYAAAVNRGYTGTKEEFETLMASYATVAEQAAESAQSAGQSATNASQSAQTAETAKGTAQQAATDAQTARASAQESAQSAQQSAQSASQSAQNAESAKETAVDAVDGFAAGAQQALESVNSAGINWKSLAEAQKLDSEAWALGTRDGEDVGTSDPAYHNNAKYYAESVSSSAQTATEAAQTATQKASDAQASASAAAESARTLTIDRTLTQSGQAADSKAVGDEIDELKEDFKYIQGGDNLFNSLTTTEGRLQASGSVYSTSGYFTSDFIAVQIGEVYYKNSPIIDAYHRLCVYSSTRHIIRDVTDSNYLTVGDGEAYIRFCGIDTEKDTAEFYKVSAKDVIARNKIVSLDAKIGGGFRNTTDETANIDNAVDGWARVNPSASNLPDIKGGYVCTFTRANSARVQIFIGTDIINGTTEPTLYIRYMYGGSWKSWINVATHPFANASDYSGNLDSFIEGVTRVVATATNNPSRVMGYCIAIKRGDAACMQMFVAADGDVYTRVSASGVFSGWKNVSAFGDAYRMSGKNGLTFGDSIMAADGKSFSMYSANVQYNRDKLSETCSGYQTFLRNHYNVTITDYAVSGEGIVQQFAKIKTADYTGIDFVIIACGTNDFSDGRAMGDLPTSKAQATSETTFAGTLCSAVKWIQSANPTTKILLMTPLQRDTTWRNSGVPDASLYATDIYTQNNKGLYVKDYRNAIISVGEMYGCVIADMYAESGLNFMTLPEYTFEGVHPTNEGYEFIMPVLYRAFEKL